MPLVSLNETPGGRLPKEEAGAAEDPGTEERVGARVRLFERIHLLSHTCDGRGEYGYRFPDEGGFSCGRCG